VLFAVNIEFLFLEPERNANCSRRGIGEHPRYVPNELEEIPVVTVWTSSGAKFRT